MNEFKLLPKVFNWQKWRDKIIKTEYYELDLATTNVANVSTIKGIVEIMNINGVSEPDPAFSTSQQIYINNPNLLLTEANRDNIYIQYSVYYKPSGTDNVVPYVVSNGIVVPNGVGFQIYNANPAIAGANNWEGKLYLYYEIYNI
jgi:hypothetical protein